VVEKMGSYLDLIVKEFCFELEGRYPEKTPLGANLHRLLKKVDSDLGVLVKKILDLNNFACAPSKHKYRPPTDPRHYFSIMDAIIILLGAVKLGEELKKRSKYVRNFCQDLCLSGQEPLVGNHPRRDDYGKPFDFKEKLLELSELVNFNPLSISS
jgi:hypothetical protein